MPDKENKTTEATFRDQQAWLSVIVDSAMDAIITVDEQQKIVLFNRAAENMFRRSAREVIGSPLELLIPERFRSGHSRHLQSFGLTGVTTRGMASARPIFGLRADGEEFPIEASISQVEASGQKLYTVIMRDVSERERAEGRFRQLIENVPNGVVMIDQKGRIVLVNAQTEKLFDYSREELIGCAVEVLLPERFRRQHSDFREAFFTAPTSRPMGMGRDLFGRRKDGSEFPVEIGLNPIQTEEGTMVLGIIVDITERKLGEAALRGSEERLQTVIENLTEGLVISELDGRLIHWNRAALEMHHFENMDECLMLLPEFENIFELSTVDGRVLSLDEWPLSQVLRGINLRDYEIRIRRLDIDWRRIFTYGGAVVREPSGKLLAFLTITDITERKLSEEALRESEEQFRQSQKMESIGRLAGGIAHDFNNLLTAINGYSELCLRQMQSQDPLRRNVNEIHRAGERAAALTRQLLAFSRKQILQPKILDVNSIILDFERMLRRVIGEDIELQTALDREVGRINADPGQIEQVIMNLVVNARDAMPNGVRSRSRRKMSNWNRNMPRRILTSSQVPTSCWRSAIPASG